MADDNFSELVSQLSVLADLFAEPVFDTLSESCQEELRRAYYRINDELQVLDAKKRTRSI